MTTHLFHQGHVYRQAAPVYVYHGTATGADDSRLKRIMKEGLNPNPTHKTFSQNNPEMATYGGVYFAYSPEDNISYMSAAADQIGGDYLLVVARIETRSSSVAPDEDRFSLFDLWQRFSIWLSRRQKLTAAVGMNILLDQNFPWQQAAQEVLAATAGQRIKPKQLSAVAPIAADLLFLALQYWVSKELEHSKNETAATWQQHFSPEQRDPDLVRQQQRQVHDRLLRKLKVLSEPNQPGASTGYTFRVTEPVAYAGANRIVAIVQIHETSQAPSFKVATVVYRTAEGTTPIKEAMSGLTAHWNGNMRWVDKDGTVLYDKKQKKKAASVRQAADPLAALDAPAADAGQPKESEPAKDWKQHQSPIMRMIRDQLGHPGPEEFGTLQLLGVKPDMPYGSSDLGYDIVGSYRAKFPLETPEPHRFRAHISPENELLAVELTSGEDKEPMGEKKLAARSGLTSVPKSGRLAIMKPAKQYLQYQGHTYRLATEVLPYADLVDPAGWTFVVDSWDILEGEVLYDHEGVPDSVDPEGVEVTGTLSKQVGTTPVTLTLKWEFRRSMQEDGPLLEVTDWEVKSVLPADAQVAYEQEVLPLADVVPDIWGEVLSQDQILTEEMLQVYQRNLTAYTRRYWRLHPQQRRQHLDDQDPRY